MTNRPTNVSEQILALRRIFAHHSAYHQLEQQFQLLLDRRRTEIAAGVTMEARGIALIGASGSGKTTAVARLLSHSAGLGGDATKTPRKDVVSFQVPSPATLKFVGQTALEALGYPLRRERTEMIIWATVRQHLQARKTLFLHLDEAQDLMRHQTPKVLQSVVRTLKSLMQTRDWPVGLVLSGMPDLKELLNHDPQLARRFYPIEFPNLSTVTDGDEVGHLTASYAQRVNLEAKHLFSDEFSARLIHSADGEFGLVVELIIAAIEEALNSGDSSLENRHFVEAFRRRSGCVDALNPFQAADFERIDARALLQNEVTI